MKKIKLTKKNGIAFDNAFNAINALTELVESGEDIDQSVDAISDALRTLGLNKLTSKVGYDYKRLIKAIHELYEVVTTLDTDLTDVWQNRTEE
jgi:uncharacterized protein Yka (UPF0111/DUF47 family)